MLSDETKVQSLIEASLKSWPDSRIDQRLPKATQVYAYLRAAIINMALEPGSALNEREACDLLGVSKTPYRDAIGKLAEEGLVDVIPSGGTFIAKIDMGHVRAGQLIRATLERETVRIAASRFEPAFEQQFELLLFQQELAAQRQDATAFFDLDNAFHEAIAACTAIPNIWQIIRRGTGQLDRVRRLSYPTVNHYAQVIREHREIFRLLRENDPEAAAKAFDIQLSHAEPIFALLARSHDRYFL